ncbi:response regulator transcription factor [Nocardioides humilatus]|uniref:Response regulator transcription factor n=1 Tax=Nocardioides humilatus TaxID=2607660 RepID=A0A5B1LMP9_9ACTN|nr:response regulator transcription factor [Nocardioides humilatus]KAA1421756.1 response regulator transcription factor [Nocardioides humilatus]
MSLIRVAAMDNHPIVLEGVGAALARSAPDMELIAIADSCEALLAGPGASADVVLLDLRMPGQGPAHDNVVRLVERGLVVLLFTAEERPTPVRRAIQAGAAGLVLKVDPIETIAQAIRDAHLGHLACSGPLAAMLLADESLGTRLSERQIEILQAVSRGLPYRLVAKNLGIAEATVREHLARAAHAYREGGIETGNVHGLITQARADGHLAE